MKLLFKILLFVFVIFQTNISEAKTVVFADVISETDFSNTFNLEKIKIELQNVISENDLANSCKNEQDLVDYRNRGAGIEAVAAKGGASLGAGRTGFKQWLQNAGNLERGQLIKDIEGAGFKKVFDGKGMMHFERGGMKIRLDPPQPGTPFNHMHLNYGGNKSAYDIFLNPVNYKSPAAHIPIR